MSGLSLQYLPRDGFRWLASEVQPCLSVEDVRANSLATSECRSTANLDQMARPECMWNFLQVRMFNQFADQHGLLGREKRAQCGPGNIFESLRDHHWLRCYTSEKFVWSHRRGLRQKWRHTRLQVALRSASIIREFQHLRAIRARLPFALAC